VHDSIVADRTEQSGTRAPVTGVRAKITSPFLFFLSGSCSRLSVDGGAREEHPSSWEATMRTRTSAKRRFAALVSTLVLGGILAAGSTGLTLDGWRSGHTWDTSSASGPARMGHTWDRTTANTAQYPTP
jgi:hypothetical protein